MSYKKNFKIGFVLLALSYIATLTSIAVIAFRLFREKSGTIALAIYVAGWVPHLGGYYFSGKGFLDLVREKRKLWSSIKDRSLDAGQRAYDLGRTVSNHTLNQTKKFKKQFMK